MDYYWCFIGYKKDQNEVYANFKNQKMNKKESFTYTYSADQILNIQNSLGVGPIDDEKEGGIKEIGKYIMDKIQKYAKSTNANQKELHKLEIAGIERILESMMNDKCEENEQKSLHIVNNKQNK